MQVNRSQESRMRKKFTMKIKSSEWDNIKRRQRDEKLVKHNTCETCGSNFNKSKIMKSNPSSTCESNNEQRNTDSRNIRETHSIRSWKNYDTYKNENCFDQHVDSSDDDGKCTNQVTLDSKCEVKPSKRYSVLRRRRLQPNNDDSGPSKNNENEYNQQKRINPLKVQQMSLQGPISSQMLVPNVSQTFERASTPVPPLQTHFPAQANFLHLTQQPSFAIQTSQPMSFIPVTSSGYGNYQFNPQDLHGEHFYSAYYPFIVPESKINMPSVPASYTTKSYLSNDLTGEGTQPLL